MRGKNFGNCYTGNRFNGKNGGYEELWKFDGQNLHIHNKNRSFESIDMLLIDIFTEKLGGKIYRGRYENEEKPDNGPVNAENNHHNKCALEYCSRLITDKNGQGHVCDYCNLRFCSCCCASRASKCQEQLVAEHNHHPNHDTPNENNNNLLNAEKVTVNKLLRYFQEDNINQVNLTPGGNLKVEYNDASHA